MSNQGLATQSEVIQNKRTFCFDFSISLYLGCVQVWKYYVYSACHVKRDLANRLMLSL